jgi:3-dehydroquinate synthase
LNRTDITVTGERSNSTIRFAPVSALATLVDPARTVIIADELTREFLPPEFDRERAVVVPRGEAAKNLGSLEGVYERFLELGVSRDWTVVGVGGGSVSDLAGFAATTWLRGIDSGFVPTTLLAMVDASVGGKNGIDYQGYKNLIGSFSQPRFVLVDTELLSSLPDYDLACGLVESIKHGIIEGDEHLSNMEQAISNTGKIDRSLLAPIIRRSVTLKAAIAAADEHEHGDRRKLNLGHTIGHGVEVITGLAHGASVAAGLASACRFALEHDASKRGGTEHAGTVALSKRIIALLDRLGLPTSLEQARKASRETSELSPASFRDAVAEALGTDKKRIGTEILFALPRAVGQVDIEPVALQELRDFVRKAP